jgi:hypothetical protein
MWGEKFRRNILPPYTLKMEAVCFSETPVAIYHMYNNRSPVVWGGVLRYNSTLKFKIAKAENDIYHRGSYSYSVGPGG